MCHRPWCAEHGNVRPMLNATCATSRHRAHRLGLPQSHAKETQMPVAAVVLGSSTDVLVEDDLRLETPPRRASTVSSLAWAAAIAVPHLGRQVIRCCLRELRSAQSCGGASQCGRAGLVTVVSLLDGHRVVRSDARRRIGAGSIAPRSACRGRRAASCRRRRTMDGLPRRLPPPC